MSDTSTQALPQNESTDAPPTHFRVAGIPVTFEASFLFVVALTASSRLGAPLLLAVWAVVSFVSILVHELGHALAFRRFGHSPRIALHGMGGTAYGSPGVELTPLRSVVVSLAGPGAGFVLGGLTLLAQPLMEQHHPVLAVAAADLLWVNFGWGVLNLLPIRPLDGGQALTSLLTHAWPQRGLLLARGVSVTAVLAAGAVAFFGGMRHLWFLLGWLAINAVQDALQQQRYDAHRRLQQARESGDTEEEARQAERLARRSTNPSDWTHYMRHAADAYSLAGCVPETHRALDALEDRGEPSAAFHGAILCRLRAHAEALAWLEKAFAEAPTDETVARLLGDCHLELGQLDALRERLDLAPGSQSDALHACAERGLFYAGRYADALAVSHLRVERFRTPHGAFNAACSLAHLGRTDEAFEALEHALTLGYADAQGLAEDEDLAPLRADPRFGALSARLAPAA